MPRKLARGLLEQGFPVTVITQRRNGQRPLETIDCVGLTTGLLGGGVWLAEQKSQKPQVKSSEHQA
jgi:hypothetical protein